METIPRPTVASSSRADADDSTPIPAPTIARPGDRLGHYLLLEEVGSGGMGVVYLAYDPRLDRRIALKILRHSALDATGSTRARLLREARSLARLTHPNVVPVFDVGEAQGAAFVAMEYVDGATLGEWLRTTRPATSGITKVFADAGRGLMAAHQLGIVHRDFKPDNVLVGADGRARVLDFGIARAGDVAAGTSIDGAWPSLGSPEDLQLTQVGTVLGTPAYMAPEQHRGEAPTPAADQYSFCVALFEALFGKRPFEAPTLTALLASKLAGEVEIPARTDVPRWLQRVVVRGLAADPAARWPALSDVVDRLDRGRSTMTKRWVALGATAAAASVVFAPGPHQPECAGRQRTAEVWNPATVTTIAAAFDATKVPYAADTWTRASAGLERFAEQWRSEHDDTCVAMREADAVAAAAIDDRIQCLDAHLDRFAALVGVLRDVDAQGVARSVAAVAALPAAISCREATAGDRLPAEGERRERAVEILRRLARVRALEGAGRFLEAVADARVLLEDAVALDHPPITAAARFFYGSALERAGDYEGARGQLREALWAALAIGSDEIVIQAGTDLVWLEGVSDPHPDQAEQWSRHAAAALARSPDIALEARLANNLGAMHSAAGRPRAARIEFERALAAFERLDDGAPSPNVASALQNIGIALGDEEQLEPAREYLTRALALYEQAEGPTHPDVGDVLDALGGIALRQGDFATAEGQLERALVLRRAALGEDHPTLGRSYNNLGALYEATGDYGAAEKAYHQALAVFESATGQSAVVGATLVNLGNTLERAGKLDEAAAALVRGLDILTEAVPADHPWVIHGQAFLGRTELRRGRTASAALWLERARPHCGADVTLCGMIDAASAQLAVLTGVGSARAFAERARTGLRAAGPAAAKDLAAFEAWVLEVGPALDRAR